ncbi:MAG: hypothetical protein A2509_00935 [Candidatus Edwardsbacteria bacterium RIFOXYD12_FULL_50_11]|uniref:Uncharacterized protein n=1 Tax=Candidatus Edwardsbacteria bacterium GWF2_54_11 TaxID=1817851 RepID=A0A1F5RCC7_9BACT|nr:MAG: hypothetical protein A2502_07540 [Candidatus Edwardsbacteria bacterium RifOxyC12_full_54_24]OGF07549.1 MAG: hypothetical protein A2273_03520 [Candidatus Edwardsbacteria bacterium RifOxyA12_full_54_48]OGF09799.1 MAG: hypothetical protein A3K15_09930 [Candidatus Edwardsbacteria bacterium GWE2_54_12]OGF12062.1 MAG: hypothetical protein A2024_03485 [Candidatus Edwardsbacteria bacterium GWF2_54_11]OGF16160.1 MAG: hypothetical protein A2509_00935 [Candidatus Edwardsbacteria bacterium RIFOXYD1
MTKSNCPHCGAAFTGLICDFCGALVGMTDTVERQRQALDELHRLIVNSPWEKQLLLIKNGYLPDDANLLMDAGLKCISLINDAEVRSGRSDAAQGRLEAVITKLQLRPRDQEISKALQLFRERLDKSARSKARDTRLGLGLFAVIFAAIIVLVMYFSRR